MWRHACVHRWFWPRSPSSWDFVWLGSCCPHPLSSCVLMPVYFHPLVTWVITINRTNHSVSLFPVIFFYLPHLFPRGHDVLFFDNFVYPPVISHAFISREIRCFSDLTLFTFHWVASRQRLGCMFIIIRLLWGVFLLFFYVPIESLSFHLQNRVQIKQSDLICLSRLQIGAVLFCSILLNGRIFFILLFSPLEFIPMDH